MIRAYAQWLRWRFFAMCWLVGHDLRVMQLGGDDWVYCLNCPYWRRQPTDPSPQPAVDPPRDC